METLHIAINKNKYKKIIFSFKGRYIFMENLDLKTKLRYDYKTNEMEYLHPKKLEWLDIQIPYHFFKGFDIEDLELKRDWKNKQVILSHPRIVCSSSKLKTLLKYTKEVSPRCRSMARFLYELKEVLNYENYIEQRIKHEKPYITNNYYGGSQIKKLKKPLSHYPASFIKLAKISGYEIDRDTESAFDINRTDQRRVDFIKNTCDSLVNLELYPEQIKYVLENIVSEYESSIEKLIINFGYDLKSLLEQVFNIYMRNEGLTFDTTISQLKDYYSMARVVKKHAEKYPKYLRSVHDIVSANFKEYEAEKERIEEAEAKIEELIQQGYTAEDLAKEKIIQNKEWNQRLRPFLEFTGNSDYVTRIPQTAMEVIAEGTDLQHCVHSYAEDIRKGRTYIFFLRHKKFPSLSEVTLEYDKGTIKTALGKLNRSLTITEFEFLKDFCEFKKLKLGKGISIKGEQPKELKSKKLIEWDKDKIETYYKKLKEKAEKLLNKDKKKVEVKK